MSYRLRDAAREAIKNLFASPILSVVTMSVAVVAFTVTLISAGITGNDVQQRYDKAVSAGAFAYLVGDRNSNTISVAACEHMNSVDGVIAAGAMIDSQESEVNDGTAQLRLVRMTQGAVRGAWPDIDTVGGVIAGPEAASRLGLTPGASLIAQHSSGAISLVISETPASLSRVSGINDAVVVIAEPVGLAKNCIVWTDPSRTGVVASALDGWMGPGTLFSPFTPDATARVEALERASSYTRNISWLLSGSAVAALVLLNWFVRRSEAALYRVLGARERSIIAGYCVDTAILALLPLQLSLLVALTVAPPSTSFVLSVVAADWLRLGCLVCLAPVSAWLMYPRRSARDVMLGA